MSDQTNNRISHLVGKSFFFTEPDKVEQSAVPEDSHAFGPMGTTEESKAASFRLGAKMKLKTGFSSAKAFAICHGNVLLQPQTGNTSKVNLILRPFKQPFNGMPVKYFIYRGLDKSDFLLVNDDTKLAQPGCEFIQEVRSDVAGFNNMAIDAVMNSSWIGYDLGTNPQTDLLDNMFFRIAPPSEEVDPVETKLDELPFVREGVELGKFSGDFQLDIVLGSPDYKQLISSTGFIHNLEFARAAEGILAVANKPTNYPEKAYREAVLDFIDPAAFWGMHANGGNILAKVDSAIVSQSETQLIYTNILKSFVTRHYTYFLIIDNLNRSFNYYNTYEITDFSDGKIILAIGSNHLAFTEYNHEFATHKWPLSILVNPGGLGTKCSAYLRVRYEGTRLFCISTTQNNIESLEVVNNLPSNYLTNNNSESKLLAIPLNTVISDSEIVPVASFIQVHLQPDEIAINQIGELPFKIPCTTDVIDILPFSINLMSNENSTYLRSVTLRSGAITAGNLKANPVSAYHQIRMKEFKFPLSETEDTRIVVVEHDNFRVFSDRSNYGMNYNSLGHLSECSNTHNSSLVYDSFRSYLKMAFLEIVSIKFSIRDASALKFKNDQKLIPGVAKLFLTAYETQQWSDYLNSTQPLKAFFLEHPTTSGYITANGIPFYLHVYSLVAENPSGNLIHLDGISLKLFSLDTVNKMSFEFANALDHIKKAYN